MPNLDAISAVESRASVLRLTLAELCKEACVKHPSWSRAKSQQKIGPRLLRKMEDALDRIEAERKASHGTA